MKQAFALRYRCMICEGTPFIDPPHANPKPYCYDDAGRSHLLENPTHELAQRVILIDVVEE